MRSEASLVAVGGTTFRWKVLREPQWSTAHGWKGMSISVELADNPSRELFIELPFSVHERRSTPHRQRPSISIAELRAFIAQALAAGWRPESRGKPFVFEAMHAA